MIQRSKKGRKKCGAEYPSRANGGSAVAVLVACFSPFVLWVKLCIKNGSPVDFLFSIASIAAGRTRPSPPTYPPSQPKNKRHPEQPSTPHPVNPPVVATQSKINPSHLSNQITHWPVCQSRSGSPPPRGRTRRCSCPASRCRRSSARTPGSARAAFFCGSRVCVLWNERVNP